MNLSLLFFFNKYWLAPKRCTRWKKKMATFTWSASLSTSMATSEIARCALWILEFLRISTYLLWMLDGSSISMTFDRSFTPLVSKYSPLTLSFPRYISLCSPGCNPVSAARSFLTSPVSQTQTQITILPLKVAIHLILHYCLVRALWSYKNNHTKSPKQ